MTSDSTVRTEDETVRTTADIFETMSETVTSSSVTTAAVRYLRERFGSVLEAEYVLGKTEFRDALVTSLQISQLAAEELCDELEQAGRIAFIQTGERFGWHIHTEGDLPDTPL